jgi:hypothetical protein
MKSRLFLIVALLLPAAPLHAIALELYAGAAVVADQSAGERQRAMPQALAHVLQKLSGLSSFADRPEVGLALEQASGIVVSFYYRNEPVLLPDGSSSERLQLVVHFSRKAVDELLRTLKLPVWAPARRPLTAWLVVDDDLGRRIMPIELEYAWQQMAETAAARGMPILRPEPDAEGVYPVDLQLLWGGYTEELAGSGPADALVIAALREGPEWNVRMNLDYGGQRWSWRQRGTGLQQLLTDGMHRAVDEISAGATIAAADRGRWNHEITVTGLANSADYARCLAYLQELSLVEGVRIVAAEPGRVRLDLELSALPDYLARTLEQDGVLSPTVAEDVYALAGRPQAKAAERNTE